MTQYSKAAFLTAFNTLFADNTTRDISEADLRTFNLDIKDSTMFLTDNFIDEDSFASDSATKAPSQQSVKAYVDATGGGNIIKATVTVSSAQLLTLGTVPVTIIAAPGANKYLSIINITASYNYGTTAYDYSAGESAYFYIGANWTGYQIAYTSMNAIADFNKQLNHGSTSEFTILTNASLTLGTQASTDPTTGDGDLDVVVYYSIEDTNT